MLDELIAGGNYIPVNRTLIKVLGLDETLLLSELCYEHSCWRKDNKLSDNDMFFCTVKRLEDKTTLSEYRQRQAIKHLEDLKILRTELKGTPPVRYFYIDEVQILNNLRFKSVEITDLNPEKLSTINNIISNNKTFLSKDKNDNKPHRTQKEEFLGSIKLTKQENDNKRVDDFVNLWKTHKNLPCLRKVSPGRRKGILNLLDNYDKLEIEQVLDNFNNSDFLLGKTTDFRASLDWMLKEDNFIKILEGKYNNRKSRSGFKDNAVSETYTDEELKQLEELNKEREARGLQTKF